MFKNITLNQIYVLSALLSQDRYGLDIIRAVKEQSGNTLLLGSLYNVLSKLERQGFVESYYSEETENRGGNRRKYYKITGAGERGLEEVQNGLSNMWGLSLG